VPQEKEHQEALEDHQEEDHLEEEYKGEYQQHPLPNNL